MNWMILPYKRYAEFSGRSRRMEFWMFTVFFYVVAGVLAMVAFSGFPWAEMMASDGASVPDFEPGPLLYIGSGLLVVFALATIVPNIAVNVRRLHDRDMSGWWYLGFTLASLIPYIGLIASIGYIVLMFLPGTRGPNRYGDDPKGPGAASVFE